MLQSCVLALTLAAPIPKDSPFELRTDAPPAEWRAEEINNGLPYRWEKGAIHLLAWEVIADDRPHRYTQILVLKRFDRPTEKGGHRWVLAQLYRDPESQEWPWRGPMRIPPPLPPGKKMPVLSDAQVFGHEFYDEPPTDDQIKTFLDNTWWPPRLGTDDIHFFGDEKRTITTKLSAGGIDRLLWKKLFDRDVRPGLFPELKTQAKK